MKIVCLLGSPRTNGNSAAVANRFCATAEGLGAQVQTFVLNELQYQGCQGCMACKIKLDRCILEDDLTEVLDAVRETDVLVLATPADSKHCVFARDEPAHARTLFATVKTGDCRAAVAPAQGWTAR